jgi:hyperosmotically inducible protein
MNARKGLITASAVCWALVAGTALASDTGSAKSSQPVADTVITTKVKAELVKDRDTKAMGVNVETKNGVVTLSGAVDSAAEKDKAEQDARGIKGVVDVTNNLSVKQ